MIDYARSSAEKQNIKNVDFMVADIYNLPFQDNKFDAAWLCTIIMHLEKPLDALKEVYRVLKPGGIICISDGNWAGDIIYPVYPLLKQVMADIEQFLTHRGVKTRRSSMARHLLREAGFLNTEGYSLTECYSTSREREDFKNFILEFSSTYYEKMKLNLSFNVIKKALEQWSNNPDAYFIRSHLQAIGRK